MVDLGLHQQPAMIEMLVVVEEPLRLAQLLLYLLVVTEALEAAALRAQLALPLLALQTLVAVAVELDRHHLLAVQEAPALLFLNILMPTQYLILVVV